MFIWGLCRQNEQDKKKRNKKLWKYNSDKPVKKQYLKSTSTYNWNQNGPSKWMQNLNT